MASLLSTFVNPDSVRQLVRSNEDYLVNRDRAGAVLHDGLVYYDTYQRFRPALFAASLAGMAASAYGLWKRRKKGPEAVTLYSLSFVVCSASAYITKPSTATPAEGGPAAPGSGPAPQGAALGYIDKRVAALKAEDPEFADKAIDRLTEMPAVKPGWDRLDPLIRAAIR